MIDKIVKHKLFIVTVFLPTLLAIVFYGFIASDRYISESQFVIKSPQKGVTSGLGTMLQSTGIGSANEDAYTVRDFILSRDALQLLDNDLNFRELYSKHTIDVISRLNGFGFEESFEDMYQYYQGYISIEIDSQSSILKLNIESFDAKSAKEINDYLVKISEDLINRLNVRSRQDLIGFAEKEVQRATEALADSSHAVSMYRKDKSIFDLESQSSLQLKLISNIQKELLNSKTDLMQIRKLSPKSSQIEILENRIHTLEKQIELENSKVVGNNNSYANKSIEFEKLLLKQEYSGKQLLIALASLEDARSEAMKKQLYLERISKANLPDIPLEPKRIKSIITIFLLGLISWGILSMLLAGIREHNE